MSAKRRTIICFAGDAWDGNPHSRHHLMRRFAERWDVLFVEGVPMRSVAARNPGETRRVLAKLRSRAGLRTVESGLHVLRPFPVPPTGRVGRRLQIETLRQQVLAARQKLALDGPVLAWFSLPVAAPLLGRLGETASLFYYQDRYDAFTSVDGPYLRECVSHLASRSDVTVASAAELAGDLRGLGAEPIVVPHGVDTARFAGSPPPPADLAGYERPLIGYVGLIDDYLDFDVLRATADRIQRGTIVLVGPQNTDVSGLEHARIALVGPRTYASIPAYLEAFACCLVPFKINRLTLAVNPIKLREYLAAGRPVVSTPLPEVAPYSDVATVAAGAGDFARAVVASLAPGADDHEQRSRRRDRVAADSWDAAAATIESIMDRAMSPTG
ncbi:MAG: hypothetical protein QOE64_1945 [Frankiales bacterium]|nr:hypothetical protein [Frankiales bacterium]